MGTNVTLQTLADEIGVSRSTVSNAFSRPDQLSAELRQRILEAAARLGYRGPNAAARTLRRGHAGAIGVVLTESLSYAFNDPYNVGFFAGLAEEAERSRQSLLIIPSPPGHNQTEGIRAAVVDSFVVFTMPDDHPVVDEIVARDVPTVFVDGPQIDGQPFVGIDDRAAMQALTRHLLGLGHRSLAVLAFRIRDDGRVGPVDDERISTADFRVTRERLAGILTTATSELGRDAVDVYEVGLNTRETARVAALEVFGRSDRSTAAICLSDEIALGALDALDELGLSAPENVSVTGFDDVPAASERGLTTVRQPAVEKGRAAGRLLSDRRVDPLADVRIPFEVVLRRTSGPAPEPPQRSTRWPR